MLIHKAYKFRLYPNQEQETLINKTFGCVRMIYNHCLAKKKEDSSLTKYDLEKYILILKKENEFLNKVDSTSLQNVVTDLCYGFDRYYKNLGGYPHFKKKGKKESYRTNCIRSIYKGTTYENIKVDLEHKMITLPKLKEVPIKGYRKRKELSGRIKNATIEKVGKKYYVSVLVEENIILPEKKENYAIGIDLGVKSIVTTSDGIYYGNPKYLNKYERKIKGLQKSLSRKLKGSKNYLKTKNKLEEVYRKLQNARKKNAEEIVSEITKNNDIIITETLKTKEMISKKENKQLRKSILNATFGLILTKLEYKCKWLNKRFIQLDSYYPSSQICSRCGYRNKEMKDIRKRKYECPKCGIKIDRDINASLNIKFKGITKYFIEKYTI